MSNAKHNAEMLVYRTNMVLLPNLTPPTLEQWRDIAIIIL